MDFSKLFQHETDTVKVAAGVTILKRGQVSEVIYVLLEGEAEVKIGDKVMYFAGPGALLGEMALIDRTPGNADVVACTECRLVAIDERRFTFLVQQTPNFALEVMKVIAERLRAMNFRTEG